jgi:pimeloyl-ACP methyl ester carboxylesterase
MMNKSRSTRIAPSTEPYAREKRYITVGPWQVAYLEAGEGEPLFLLHGCPFQSWEWHAVIPMLAPHFHVIAPDLLGLGDTLVDLEQDYRLPQQVEMVIGLMDALGFERARFVGHDHGGAILQLMMKHHPDRIAQAVLTNAEAYDQWPSDEERPYVAAVVNPWISWFMRLALRTRWVQREIFSIAVADSRTLTDSLLDSFILPHTATRQRWQRLRRFNRWQLDRDHNLETQRAVDGMRKFTKPTLILWGKRDGNFGSAIAERLARDIPGARGVHYLEQSAHLPMLEEPRSYADALIGFFAGEPRTNEESAARPDQVLAR